MIKAVLFDYDYTLAEASGGILCGFDYALDKMGLPRLPHEGIKKGIGGTLEQIYETAGGDLSKLDFAEFRKYYIEGSVPHIEEFSFFFDDVKPSFRRLTENGIKIGVVTNKSRRHVVNTFARDGLTEYCSVVIGHEDMTAPKPDKNGPLKAASILDVKPEETLFSGDSLYDAEAASNAGMPFGAVLTGHCTKQDFDRFDSLFIADNLAALTDMILGYNKGHN